MLKNFFEEFNQKFAQVDRRDRILIAVTTIINLAIFILFLFVDFSEESIAAYGYLGVGISNLLNSATLMSFVPVWATTMIAAKGLNGPLVVLIATSVTTIGESVAYFMGDGVDKLIRDYKWHKTFRKWFYKSPFLFLVIWIGLPNPAQSIGQVFAGSVEYPYWKYILATFIGNIIWFSILVYIGQNASIDFITTYFSGA